MIELEQNIDTVQNLIDALNIQTSTKINIQRALILVRSQLTHLDKCLRESQIKKDIYNEIIDKILGQIIDRKKEKQHGTD